MVLPDVFRAFVEESPVSVMFRGTLERVLAAARLDVLFGDSAQRQCCGDLAISDCAELLALVVTLSQPAGHAAYRAPREKVAVPVPSLYNTLAGVAPQAADAWVRPPA